MFLISSSLLLLNQCIMVVFICRLIDNELEDDNFSILYINAHNSV